MQISQVIARLAHEMQYIGDAEVICQEIDASKLGDCHHLQYISTRGNKIVLTFEKKRLDDK